MFTPGSELSVLLGQRIFHHKHCNQAEEIAIKCFTRTQQLTDYAGHRLVTTQLLARVVYIAVRERE